MKSVGEVMAIGRTFKESFKRPAVRWKSNGLVGQDGQDDMSLSDADLEKLLVTPTPDRLFALPVAIQRGFSVEKMHELSKIDPWFTAIV